MAKSTPAPNASSPSQGQADNQGRQVQVTAAPDLEYHYRDFFNIHIGVEEVVLEFGNRHRPAGDKATVGNRIVLSVPNAFRLHQALGQGLQNAQKAIQKQREENSAKEEGAS